jgi:hypothetical protein
MKGKISGKTIIIVLILLLTGVLLVMGAGTVRNYLGSAAAGSEPKNVTAVSNSDGRGAIVSWQSDKESMGVVEYGTTPASLLLRAVESESVVAHRLSLSPLKAGVNYYYRIRVGDEIYDNGGIPYSFKTEAEAVVPEVSLVPTLAPLAPVGADCSAQSDYNGDGVINSLDMIDCRKAGGSVPPTSVKPTVSECDGDYDGNGVVNSIDRIKCLQDK